MNAQRRRPTQVDIARRVGVSQATVSLVISGGPASSNVAEETRQAVLQAAAELGYTVNAAARRLKGGRSRMLGLYTFESVFPVDQRDFYFPFLLGVEEATARQGYDLLLFSSTTGADSRRIYTDGVNRLKVADGCVLLGRHLDRDDLADLVHEDFPFVFIGRREVPGGNLSYVGADYVGATRDMVRMLVAQGHRRLAYLKLSDELEPTRDREEGFRLGLDDAGIAAGDARVHPVGDAHSITSDLLRDWVSSGVTALLVEPGEDDATISAVAAAADAAGIGIPSDCSVVLLGDPPLGESSPDWTRYSLPREEMGREAVRLLLDLLDSDDREPRQLSLACTPVPGASVGAPPSGAPDGVGPR
ncbi:transcriptional regulator, LacI family [Beutenbergia cavernae DSM 12333]|uniref:Transcriptional regulator, LacI family n=1 Tax=Beutenbergia cavernae (strain ATCC BAA-8 / DSM 12333 / CCUG 43141 / JCM 11478 / NBRC 16432 / NCIMB 13614 / HKI 0122) TaxID=471853 RepID=C5C269_BEUC1|nr:LacI family DNA-binding transcriptional regulator [Beutenbergia cavernae]ACQ81694.1 transcriptional regulator, LacI family [Beutenbergia cavernae DSM 12333]